MPQSASRKLQKLDLFTGIGGFVEAAKRNGRIETICASEIDSYNCKLIDQNLNLDNAGDIATVCISRDNHPYSDGADVVHAEETGFTSLCLEDFFEGVVPFPDIATGGFPCQNISSANLGDVSGIDGEKSSLVTEQLRIIEDLGIPINIFENAEALIRKGLDRILVELNEMGYIVEWETISATAFNFPHYRHRVYVVAYLPDTAIAQTNSRVFDSVRWVAQYNLEKPFKFPLLNEDPDFVRANAVAEDTRAIKLRTKRINGLGNAVLPSIPKAIFDSITHIELDKVLDDDTLSAFEESMPAAFSVEDGVMCDLSGVHAPVMPTRGIMKGGVVYSDQKRCPLLNPTKTAYSGLYSTLIRKDGHNFTTKSRLNRPGKLGGLVGEIMSIGVDKGGLHPEFCEMFMDYSPGYTELKPPPAPIR